MIAVATNHLPLPTPLLQAAVTAGPKDDPNSQNEGAWQRALASAAQDTASSVKAASVATASRLFDLNAVMATPAAELVMAPLTPEPRVLVPPFSGNGARPARADVSDASGFALLPPRAARVTARVETCDAGASAESNARASVVGDDASAPTHRLGGAASSGRAGEGASTSHGAALGEVRPVVLAFTTPLAGPERAFAAYAEAMSASPAASDAATSFALVSGSSTTPVRVHVQWRGRLADVWIGLHRRSFDLLPDIRAGIQDWVSSRGGVVGRLICNGERLDGAPTLSSSFPGVL